MVNEIWTEPGLVEWLPYSYANSYLLRMDGVEWTMLDTNILIINSFRDINLPLNWAPIKVVSASWTAESTGDIHRINAQQIIKSATNSGSNHRNAELCEPEIVIVHSMPIISINVDMPINCRPHLSAGWLAGSQCDDTLWRWTMVGTGTGRPFTDYHYRLRFSALGSDSRKNRW